MLNQGYKENRNSYLGVFANECDGVLVLRYGMRGLSTGKARVQQPAAHSALPSQGRLRHRSLKPAQAQQQLLQTKGVLLNMNPFEYQVLGRLLTAAIPLALKI